MNNADTTTSPPGTGLLRNVRAAVFASIVCLGIAACGTPDTSSARIAQNREARRYEVLDMRSVINGAVRSYPVERRFLLLLPIRAEKICVFLHSLRINAHGKSWKASSSADPELVFIQNDNAKCEGYPLHIFTFGSLRENADGIFPSALCESRYCLDPQSNQKPSGADNFNWPLNPGPLTYFRALDLMPLADGDYILEPFSDRDCTHYVTGVTAFTPAGEPALSTCLISADLSAGPRTALLAQCIGMVRSVPYQISSRPNAPQRTHCRTPPASDLELWWIKKRAEGGF